MKDLTWFSDRIPGLLATLVGLGFIGIAYLDAQYRYFHLVVAVVALCYGYKRLSRRETPFERREREMRRNFR
jgi:hypothetical protein